MKPTLPKPLILLLLYAIVFLNAFGYSLIMPVLSNMLSSPDHGLIPEAIFQRFGEYVYSFVLGGGSLACLLFAPMMGRISDWLGRKVTLIGATILMFVSFILPIAALALSSLWLFFLGNTINGISSNTQPIAQAAISDLTKQKAQTLARRYCIDISVVVAAMTAGPSLGEFLSDTKILKIGSAFLPFYVGSILAFLSILFVAFFLPETNLNRLKIRHRFSGLSFAVFTDARHLSPSILRLLCVCFLAQSAWGQYFQYLFIYLPQAFHFSHASMTLFAFTSGCVMIFALLIGFSFLSRWFNFRKIICFSMGISALSMLALALIHQVFVQWLFMPLLSAFIGIYFPALLTLLSTLTEIHQRGWVLSLSNSIIGLAWLITGFSAIWLASFSVHWPMLFSAFALIGAWLVMRYDLFRSL